MKDLLKKDKKDLEKELGEKNISLRDLRFGVAGSKNKNVKQYSNLKKEIARIKTAISQKNKE
jgi:ribosomal protein L29